MKGWWWWTYFFRFKERVVNCQLQLYNILNEKIKIPENELVDQMIDREAEQEWKEKVKKKGKGRILSGR